MRALEAAIIKLYLTIYENLNGSYLKRSFSILHKERF